MSQLGMQMPGSAAARRKPSLNAYTGLLFLAVVCLAAACVVMWFSATRVSPEEAGPMAPFSLQEQRGGISLPNASS
jgi:hypothetical protein